MAVQTIASRRPLLRHPSTSKRMGARVVIEVEPPPVRTRAPRPVNMDKINRIRAAIARGDYDDPQRLNEALDRLLERVAWAARAANAA